jgi:adenine phosphoribosyltransferase
MDLRPLIRDVPDFPKKGILFKDITPLLGNAAALAFSIDAIATAHLGKGITKVVGIESRGFIIAPAVALRLQAGFVPIRKPGKLPWKALSESYGLEYGKDTIQIHEDSLLPTDRVLLVDDVLATGGTMNAALTLVSRVGATIVGTAFLIDLAFLGGAAKLRQPIYAVVTYT